MLKHIQRPPSEGGQVEKATFIKDISCCRIIGALRMVRAAKNIASLPVTTLRMVNYPCGNYMVCCFNYS
jgi:hypothetical protein